jgi:hypothetical protein
MIAIIGLIVVIIISLMLAYRNANNEHKKTTGSELTVNEWLKSSIDEDLKGLIKLLIGTFVIMAVLGTLSFRVYLSDNSLEGWSMENISNWINNTETVDLPTGFADMTADEVLQNNPDLTKRYTFVKVIAGLAFGIVFGFIDNAGLFFGMDALDPYIKRNFGDDDKLSAGIGNTFSDVIGAFAGAFAGNVMESYMKKSFPKDIDDCVSTPLWADSVGIFIGCVLGIVIPRAMVG